MKKIKGKASGEVSAEKKSLPEERAKKSNEIKFTISREAFEKTKKDFATFLDKYAHDPIEIVESIEKVAHQVFDKYDDRVHRPFQWYETREDKEFISSLPKHEVELLKIARRAIIGATVVKNAMKAKDTRTAVFEAMKLGANAFFLPHLHLITIGYHSIRETRRQERIVQDWERKHWEHLAKDYRERRPTAKGDEVYRYIAKTLKETLEIQRFHRPFNTIRNHFHALKKKNLTR